MSNFDSRSARLRALTAAAGLSLVLGIMGLAPQGHAGVLSADFNADGVVSQSDYDAFLQNYSDSGPNVVFAQGDANGDQHVRLFCDIVPIIEQFGMGFPGAPFTSGSTSVPTATYTPSTGLITINPDAMNGQAVSALYLVNTAGGTVAGVNGPNGVAVLEVNNGAFPVAGFAAGSTSIVTNDFFMVGMDTLGANGASIVYSVPANTPVTDLQMYFQRAAQTPLPLTITDTASQLTYTAALPADGLCPCVPEPATAALLGLGCLALLRRRA